VYVDDRPKLLSEGDTIDIRGVTGVLGEDGSRFPLAGQFVVHDLTRNLTLKRPPGDSAGPLLIRGLTSFELRDVDGTYQLQRRIEIAEIEPPLGGGVWNKIVTVYPHGYVTGDEVFISGFVAAFRTKLLGLGPLALNNRYFKITVIDETGFTLDNETVDHSAPVPFVYPEGWVQRVDRLVDYPDVGTWASGGTVSVAGNQISNLDHLEGEEVTIVANGCLLDPVEVVGGVVVIDDPFSVAQVGLPYRSRLKTLPINLPTGTLTGVRKRTPEVVFKVVKTAGFSFGVSDQSLQGLINPGHDVRWGLPESLFDADIVEPVNSLWGESDSMIVQQDDPYPFTLLAIVLSVEANPNG
jgi:hypothetical protein